MSFHRNWRSAARDRRAFTLIELLIVVAISAIFSTIAILYSSVGRNAVTLSVEESKVSQFILQAKQLALSTYTVGNATSSCAFGVAFDLSATPQTYSIFSYDPGTPTCPPDNVITSISSGQEKEYTGGTWQVPVSQGVVLKSESHSDGLVTVLFYPPEPSVFLLREGDVSGDLTQQQTFSVTPNDPGTANVYLETVDGKNDAILTVDSEGQISFSQ
jgi:prepilin-type N-terminal cleavage/methylation domain-containing protein